jgi:hypothetical protein
MGHKLVLWLRTVFPVLETPFLLCGYIILIQIAVKHEIVIHPGFPQCAVGQDHFKQSMGLFADDPHRGWNPIV